MPQISTTDLETQKPIFIVGSKRGGTTLLRRVINAHSLVAVPPPGWFYHFIYSHLYSYGDLQQKQNLMILIDDCLNLPTVKQYWDIQQTSSEIFDMLGEHSFRAVLTAIFGIYSQRYNKPLWGSKTPSNVFWLTEIQNDFPAARFILIYRDGRDVGVDQVEANWGPGNLYTASLSWQSYVQAMLQFESQAPTGSFYRLGYEQFVTDPQAALKGVCQFLDLDYQPDMLKFHQDNSEAFLKHDSHHQASKPITDQYVGIYKHLPPSERQLQIAVIGQTLEELGYAIDDKPRTIDFWERQRYLEEDRHGGLILEGAVQYKNMLKAQRQQRRDKNIWTAQDKSRFFHP